MFAPDISVQDLLKYGDKDLDFGRLGQLGAEAQERHARNVARMRATMEGVEQRAMFTTFNKPQPSPTASRQTITDSHRLGPFPPDLPQAFSLEFDAEGNTYYDGQLEKTRMYCDEECGACGKCSYWAERKLGTNQYLKQRSEEVSEDSLRWMHLWEENHLEQNLLEENHSEEHLSEEHLSEEHPSEEHPSEATALDDDDYEPEDVEMTSDGETSDE